MTDPVAVNGTSSNDTATVWSADDNDDDCRGVHNIIPLPITYEKECSFDLPDTPAAAGMYRRSLFHLSISSHTTTIRKLCEGVHIFTFTLDLPEG